ncbi:hypothetical protein CSC70_00315 [Pseudoxanthomonas kalamensis DSM 18571]|uniref:EamA family transporter n=1 Tax=Pseudoxanthomonas kalamensis TaxID=289483 RepID=UPI001390AA48|nr:EamA/RhaT family transporter [Pseudoxanthomonas kalamensis]KAF1712018.1 hypothetical protein CSC70_00315 [Pseudoxanthomonas kalamensis DSM 18571]
MSYLLLSVLCSVAVSVLLKLLQRRGIDAAQAIGWNYLAAALLCWQLLDPPLQTLAAPDAPHLALAALALLLPGIFLALAASVRAAGIVRTDVAQRLSLLLSLLAAFLWFGETAGAMRVAGLLLGLLAVVLLVLRPNRATAPAGDAGQWSWPLTVLVGFACIDVLLKTVAAAGTPLAASLQVAFTAAFVLMTAFNLLRAWHGRLAMAASAFWAGLLLGLLNFGNLLFYLHAHRALPEHPAVVFSTMNIGVVLLGTVVGVLGFGERLARINWLAIPLAVLAIALIAAGT